MSEKWREGEGDNGLSRFGALGALPAILAFWIMVLATTACIMGLCGCTIVDKAIEVGERYDIDISKRDTPETPPDAPQTVADATPHVDVWHGGDLSGATVDDRYQLTISPDGRHWSNCPDDWQGGMLPAKCVVAYPEGGRMHAGYYDWLPRPSRKRDFLNFRGNQNGITPPRGQTLYLWAVEGNGRRRSATVHQFVWDGRH